MKVRQAHCLAEVNWRNHKMGGRQPHKNDDESEKSHIASGKQSFSATLGTNPKSDEISGNAMFIERDIRKAIEAANRFFPALLLTGARQVGKTTFLRRLALC